MISPRGLRSRQWSWIPLLTLIPTICAAPAFTATGVSLSIQPGARQNGMGAAGVALFGDPSDALWWNPAALGFADRTSVQFTYAELLPPLANLPYYHVAAAAPLGSFGGFGTSFTRVDYGSDPFPADESSPSIALGARVHPLISVGANLKWVNVSYGLIRGETFSTDIGALLRLDRGPWRFGFGAEYQNLGGKAKFSLGGMSQSEPLGRNYKIGASAAVPIKLTEKLTAGGTALLDYNRSDVDDKFHTWNGGVEGHVVYEDFLRFAARGGYYYDPRGEIKDFTYGIGVRAWLVAVDGAWIPQARNADLDRVFKITAGVHVDLSAGRPRWPMD